MAFGILALRDGYRLPLIVMKSRAGYYLGTRDVDGSPYSRESEEYFQTQKEADYALNSGIWTQRNNH